MYFQENYLKIPRSGQNEDKDQVGDKSKAKVLEISKDNQYPTK